MDVRRGVATHRGEIAIADAIAAYHDIAGAIGVDGVAVLAGAAGTCLDVLDPVAFDQRAVIADRVAQDFDAVLRCPADGVAGYPKAARIERNDSGDRNVGEGVAAEVARDEFKPGAAASAGGDRA